MTHTILKSTWLKAINMLSEREQNRVIIAVYRFQIFNEIPHTMSKKARVAFNLIAKQINPCADLTPPPAPEKPKRPKRKKPTENAGTKAVADNANCALTETSLVAITDDVIREFSSPDFFPKDYVRFRGSLHRPETAAATILKRWQSYGILFRDRDTLLAAIRRDITHYQ